MIVPARLLADLQRFLKRLEDDIRRRVQESAPIDARLREQYEKAKGAARTAQAYEIWLDEYITQVAVAWILGCVFIRFLEDNSLLDTAWLSGPGVRLQLARDQHTLYFQSNPSHSDREYLEHVFAEVAKLPSMRALLDGDHNPLTKLGPTGDGAHALLDFWQRVAPETGMLLHDFTDPELSTRFLGDLYQELSESARKHFALLQTPEFVEEFILDRTLSPAISEFGLSTVRVIDPACGSGHFLLGAYRRLFRFWNESAPAIGSMALAQRCLKSLSGVDLNPYAIAITRFRLLIAALESCQIRKLSNAPAFEFNLASGDSLLHGPRPGELAFRQMYLDGREPLHHVYEIEDADELRRILSGRYQVVVGNPPYISVDDRVLATEYRKRFSACYKQFSLVAPFVQRFFDLAVHPHDDSANRCGYIGMIVADSFMKAAFGKRLIEKHLNKVDLTEIIDTSRAYIPGHATPTVILLGRAREATGEKVRTVVGIQGEPSIPEDPSHGVVWTEILDAVSDSNYRGHFVTTMDLARSRLTSHPWVFSDFQSTALLEQINEQAERKLSSVAQSIGFYQDTHSDEAFVQPLSFVRRFELQSSFRDHVRGDDIRDWCVESDEAIFFPYDTDLKQWDAIPEEAKLAWFHDLKPDLWNRKTFTRRSYRQEGRPWFDYHQFPKQRAKAPMLIAFAALASHNHFVLDRAKHVFSRSAPVIHLRSRHEEDHFALLGVLNSSLACFWIKQMMRDKGNGGIGGGIGSEPWERRYLIDGTKLEQFPLSHSLPTIAVRRMQDLIAVINENSPENVLKSFQQCRIALDRAKALVSDATGQAVALQEEMDWLYYRAYGLTNNVDVTFPGDYQTLPSITNGQRAFEILLARSGEAENSEWFRRHRIKPQREIPQEWSENYRRVVERRIEVATSETMVGLLERPEHKRRWNTDDWDTRTSKALRRWLLDRLDSPRYWSSPNLLTSSRIADAVQSDDRFCEVAQVYKGRIDVDWLRLIEELVETESVPALGILYLAPSGLVKRELWEQCSGIYFDNTAPNSLTREVVQSGVMEPGNNGDEDQVSWPVPPRFEKGDFLKSNFWNLRGKLNVPRERFMSFPFCGRDVDRSLVIGWAGWNHLLRAQAIASYYEHAKNFEGWTPERRAPLLTAISELLPSLKRWHNDIHPEFRERMGDFFEQFVQDEARAMEMTVEQIRSWVPPTQAGRGRRKRSS